MVRRLWRNRDKRCSQFLKLRQRLLIRTQFQIAVRTPLAAIENDDDRPLRKQLRERHRLVQRVGQREIRYLLIFLQREFRK